MATKPINVNPTADLPTNWTSGQTVAPAGTDVGLTTQHGYNYLMSKVNEALTDIGTLNNGFANVQDSISANGILKGTGGTISAAVAGTDYVAPNGNITGTAAGLSATLGVGSGGTGSTTLTANAILAGNGTSAIKKITTASGALYATGANTAASFGTLPVAQGGTGAATLTSNAVLTGNGTNAVAGVATASGALFATSSGGAASFGTLPVGQGGTGATTFTSGRALIGDGANAITTRAITNNTATSSAVTGSTNLVTMNTLRYAINRATSVGAADTNYSTYMARGQALVSTETTPGSNGQIAWVYE